MSPQTVYQTGSRQYAIRTILIRKRAVSLHAGSMEGVVASIK